MTTWSTRICLLTALLGSVSAAFSEPYVTEASDVSIAGRSSLIVVGKVTAVQETSSTDNGTVHSYGIGRATLAVEQSFKGPVSKTVAIQYLTKEKKVISDQMFHLAIGEKHLFFLDYTHNEYWMHRSPRDVKEVAAFKKIVVMLPVVTITAPVTVTMQLSDRYTIHVYNPGPKTIIVESRDRELMSGHWGTYLYACYGTGEELPIQVLAQPETPADPITLKPGQAVAIPLGVSASLPKELVLAQIYICAVVSYRIKGVQYDFWPDAVVSNPASVLLSLYEPTPTTNTSRGNLCHTNT